MPIYAKITQASQGRDVYVIARIDDINKTISKPGVIDITSELPAPKVGWFYVESVGFSEDLPAAALRSVGILSPHDFFIGRLTSDERGKVFALMENDGGGVVLDMIQRGRLKAWVMLSTANQVYTRHHETVFIINALENAGAFDPGRAAEILA